MLNVQNMISNKGNIITNQFIIKTKDSTIFQSYNSIIVEIKKGKIKLDKRYWNYSNTTSKYRNIFLRESTKETKEKIKTGEYKLVDLNKGALR